MTTTYQDFQDLCAHYLARVEMSTLHDGTADLVSRLCSLNDDELTVVAQVVDGLVVGREVYGPLDIGGDARDFSAEAAAELRDATIYQTVETIRRQRIEARYVVASVYYDAGPTKDVSK